jgi:hypothetical protein
MIMYNTTFIVHVAGRYVKSEIEAQRPTNRIAHIFCWEKLKNGGQNSLLFRDFPE